MTAGQKLPSVPPRGIFIVSVERVTPEHHAEFHGVSVGQGEIHLPSVVTELHGGLDHQALFRDARGVLDQLATGHAFLTTHHNAAVVLNGGHVKFDPLLSILDEQLDVVCLKGGGLRSRIDEGFDGRHSQMKETAPLHTSNHMHGQRLKKGAQKYGQNSPWCFCIQHEQVVNCQWQSPAPALLS